MNRFRYKPRIDLLVCILVSLSFFLGGCARKAKLIQAGAAQFEVQSLAAIEKIDELRRKEVETAPMTQGEASQFFINSLKKSSLPITLEKLRIIVEPLKLNTATSEKQWQAFLQKMRRQYTAFSAAFASLDKGSLFAASEVKRTIPVLDKLITQMASFAKSIQDNPPEFIRERAAIAEEIEYVLEAIPSVGDTEADAVKIIDLKLLELERRLRAIHKDEKEMASQVIEQALKAATLGSEFRKLLVNYDQISIDDISEGLTIAFKLAGTIPGLDLSQLEARTDQLISNINKDKTLKGLFDTALTEINNARER